MLKVEGQEGEDHEAAEWHAVIFGDIWTGTPEGAARVQGAYSPAQLWERSCLLRKFKRSGTVVIQERGIVSSCLLGGEKRSVQNKGAYLTIIAD